MLISPSMEFNWDIESDIDMIYFNDQQLLKLILQWNF